MVTFLWRASGTPEIGTTSPFSDVSADAYYYDAVLWAVEQGITGGTGGGKFSPDTPCTRAQMATFLWRANGSTEVTGTTPFSDVSAETYYYNAVLWALSLIHIWIWRVSTSSVRPSTVTARVGTWRARPRRQLAMAWAKSSSFTGLMR